MPSVVNLRLSHFHEVERSSSPTVTQGYYDISCRLLPNNSLLETILPLLAPVMTQWWCNWCSFSDMILEPILRLAWLSRWIRGTCASFGSIEIPRKQGLHQKWAASSPTIRCNTSPQWLEWALQMAVSWARARDLPFCSFSRQLDTAYFSLSWLLPPFWCLLFYH